MDKNDWLTLAVFSFGAIALTGFFCTKSKGFGRFTTSTLLLLLVVAVSATLYSAGRLNEQSFINLFFAVVGFAGGLFVERKPNEAQDGTE